MTEASNIADNTLEHTVRSLLWALRAPEILKAASGERRAAASYVCPYHPTYLPIYHFLLRSTYP